MARDPGQRRWLPLRLAVIALVVLVALVVAILARPETSPPEGDLVLDTYQGAPGGSETGADMEPGWVLGDDGRLAVFAAGSSSCPWTPTAVTADGDRVTVRLEIVDGPQCTADMGYTTHVVALPDEVDPDRVEVELDLVGRS